MTECQQFIAMLTRAGIGHGLRHDFDPNGTAVQVEIEDEEGTRSGFRIAEFGFDSEGNLREIVTYPGVVE